MEKNGHISDVLAQLEECGMVSSDEGMNPASGKAVREKHYRLRDNYTRFFLKYIEPVKKPIDAGAFSFGSLDELAGWESVMGLAFENLVVNNAAQLIGPLGIGGAHVISCAPYRRSGKDGDGVQVDLLIQTQRAVYVVEAKRRHEIGGEKVFFREAVYILPGPEGGVDLIIVYDGEAAVPRGREKRQYMYPGDLIGKVRV